MEKMSQGSFPLCERRNIRGLAMPGALAPFRLAIHYPATGPRMEREIVSDPIFMQESRQGGVKLPELIQSEEDC